jgi:signal transduction histidine kinase
MAHELKNPLGAVKGFAKILDKTLANTATERQSQCLAMIEQNSNRINQLINELLDLSHIEAGKLQLHLQSVNVLDILNSVLEAFTPIAEEDGLQLQKTYTITTPLTTRADPDRLWQIVSNLVSNAIKYTEQGAITINAEQLTLAALGDCICISVKDSGIGIREEDFSAIFNQFETVNHNLKKNVASTGLGLPIAHQLVKLHGGRIDVESLLGSGSTFRVYLPIR